MSPEESHELIFLAEQWATARAQKAEHSCIVKVDGVRLSHLSFQERTAQREFHEFVKSLTYDAPHYEFIGTSERSPKAESAFARKPVPA